MLRRNGPVMKSVESVLRLEGSLWGERFVEEVGGVVPSRPSYRHFFQVNLGYPVPPPVSFSLFICSGKGCGCEFLSRGPKHCTTHFHPVRLEQEIAAMEGYPLPQNFLIGFVNENLTGSGLHWPALPLVLFQNKEWRDKWHGSLPARCPCYHPTSREGKRMADYYNDVRRRGPRFGHVTPARISVDLIMNTVKILHLCRFFNSVEAVYCILIIYSI